MTTTARNAVSGYDYSQAKEDPIPVWVLEWESGQGYDSVPLKFPAVVGGIHAWRGRLWYRANLKDAVRYDGDPEPEDVFTSRGDAFAAQRRHIDRLSAEAIAESYAQEAEQGPA